MRIIAGIAAVIAGGLVVPGAFATTYLVRPDGTGDFPTIQAAIDASEAGDEIVLGDGTYRGEGNRDLECSGKAIVLRSESDSPEDCVLDCEGSDGIPRRGARLASDERGGTVLRGISITHGWAEGVVDWERTGGAVLCEGAELSVENCVFVSNSAWSGGAVTACCGSKLAVLDCVFEENTARDLFAGYGALRISACEDAVVERCEFRSNIGLTAMTSGQTNVVIRDCEFAGNSQMGLACDQYSPGGSYAIEGCRFYGNGGSALQAGGGTALLTNSMFYGNASERGAAMVLDGGFTGIVSGCTAYGNIAEVAGGAVSCGHANVVFSSCTFAHNAAPGGGGGIHCGAASAVTIERSIIAFGTDGPAVGGSADIFCTDLYGNLGGDWVGEIADQFGINGNISADPAFCNQGDADFHLEVGSPCAPDANPDCGLIGALPVGCGSTPLHEVSWGEVKALFLEKTATQEARSGMHFVRLGCKAGTVCERLLFVQ